MNVKSLSVEVKALITGVAFISFLVSPLFWGSIVLMALGVSDKPWPAVIALGTMTLIAFSWLVMWNRIKSDWLVVIDIVLGVFMAGSILGTSSDLTEMTQMTWSFIIYSLSAMLVFLHANLALFSAIGIEISKKNDEATDTMKGEDKEIE